MTMKKRERMQLVVTIDTEEDNWLPYSHNGYTVGNIERLPQLQALCSDFGIRPTYLVTYQVVTNDRAAAILKDLLATGSCEIGAHCHPWNTPPFTEPPTLRNSMLCNLSPALQESKIRALTDAITSRFGIAPTSFRSGRWGYSHVVAETLHTLGYQVDSSITAYTNWGYCDGPDFSRVPPTPFRFSPKQIYREDSAGPLLEVPATVGYLQTHVAACNAIVNSLRRGPLRHLHLIGVLDRLHVINQVALSPEKSTATQMIALAQRMHLAGYPILNMFFHSSTLTAGLTPFVTSTEDERRLFESLAQFFAFARNIGFESVTLSEAQRSFPGPMPISLAAVCA